MLGRKMKINKKLTKKKRGGESKYQDVTPTYIEFIESIYEISRKCYGMLWWARKPIQIRFSQSIFYPPEILCGLFFICKDFFLLKFTAR